MVYAGEGQDWYDHRSHVLTQLMCRLDTSTMKGKHRPRPTTQGSFIILFSIIGLHWWCQRSYTDHSLDGKEPGECVECSPETKALLRPQSWRPGLGFHSRRGLLPASQEETSWGFLVSWKQSHLIFYGSVDHPMVSLLYMHFIHAFTPTKAKYNFYPTILYVQILRRSLRFGKSRGLRWDESEVLLTNESCFLVDSRPMFMATKADIIARRSCSSFTIEENGKIKQNALTIMVNRQL